MTTNADTVGLDNRHWAGLTDEQGQEMLHLLKQSQQLGLNFDMGHAYIRRSYIDKQTQLNKRIDALLEEVKALYWLGSKHE